MSGCGGCRKSCPRLVDENGDPFETVNGVTTVPTNGVPVLAAPGGSVTVTEEFDADGNLIAYVIG